MTEREAQALRDEFAGLSKESRAAYRQGYADGVDDERAAVVAWLRKSANDTMLDPATDRQVYARTYSALHRHADMIERGEHRREGEK